MSAQPASSSFPSDLPRAIPRQDVPRFAYRRRFGPPGICHLRIYSTPDDRHVALITESAENHGPSIMAAAETIATDIVRTFALDPHTTIFVEHFDDRAWTSAQRVVRNGDGLRRRDGEEDFDRVTFTVLHDETDRPFLVEPNWRAVRKHQLERLLGGTLP
jgi:hypothetical protein